ncbi:TPA: hypothetical protein UNJ94_000082 [Stenotrophomonas maltophilia]|uniref:host nuclease inhibitor protein n=1 Tax=Stenotrophomonas maltophilia TaxID=40324 RepID=UPI000B517A58|nr:host nuclease inhibitor protein [Stenotrophomonas maltophilia]ASE54566.1 host nuclease inhibitor protein [Stenotrophomonas maltophilia]ELE7121458.1 hypothetical protein [Stenotrophomonas maltophilia]MBH1555196.1 hypothetical protein [Stenotrophomonas maltophilia]MBH1676271.1 hypothetical protein [Stenotrophomonas maltophilia]MBH1780281.1 hypothetical protein [Stenotrophomonas maltophilia]
MIAYCWANGQIGFGTSVPDGAIFIAEGSGAQLRKVISVVARHGKGLMQGMLVVPSVPEAETQQAKGDALGLWLAWCAQHPRRLRWGAPTANSGCTVSKENV